MLVISKDLEKRELILERVVRGSRGKAWEGWTLPQHISRGWGPRYWTTTVYEMDVRVGGVWHYCMRPKNGEGEEVWGRAVYREIVKPSRMVYIESRSNEKGDMLESGGADGNRSICRNRFCRDETRYSHAICDRFGNGCRRKNGHGFRICRGFGTL